MKVRNIIHKAAVLGTGAVMTGATVMSALAYDLADYPADFIVDGNFDGKIVVGENAATADVLGSIDIAASLQARSVSSEEVDVPGMAGEVSLSGDAFRIETSNDLLEIRETVGDVYDTLTESELDALRGGTITTDQGSTDYNQYLRFAEDGSSSLQEMAVNYVEDEDNVLGDFLVIDDAAPFFEWEIEFSEGLESAVGSSSPYELTDLEDEVFNIFGTDFTFVDSSADSTTVTALTLEFMAGDVSDTLREGETKTYTIDGVDYEVTAVFISDPSAGSSVNEAKFAVNGEITDSLADGDTDTLNSGLQIGVRDLLVNSREGVVEFFLGANKVEFTDAAVLTESFASGVEIGSETIEDASIAIVGAMTGSDFEITSIKYRLDADAKVGSTIYVPAGMGVREFLDEPEGLLSPTFDIEYHGLKDVDTTELSLDARSDHSYDLTLTSLRGKEYSFPFVTNKAETFKFGDDDDDFVFVEPTMTLNATGDVILPASFNIGDDDYFVVSENAVGSATEKDDSAVLRYEDIDTSDRILTFTDMASGESKTVSYTSAVNGTSLGIASNFVVEGQTYTIWVGDSTTSYKLGIDMDASGVLDAAEVGFTVKGGAILDFADSDGDTGVITFSDDVGDGQSMAQADTFNTTLTVPAVQFDGSTAPENMTWTLSTATAANEISMAFNAGSYAGPNAGASDVWDDFDVLNDDSNDDYDRGLTDYGILIEYYNPSGDDAPELTLSVPEAQVGAQVFVTAGVTEASAGGSGSIMRDRVNPISVGMAVLDSDADGLLGSENLIIVGGPCANAVASEVLGNPANCAEGFEPGKAMIRASEHGDTVAVLVAGYEAQETLGASYVLADYAMYLADVEGSEVEVVATDLNNLQVSAAMADEE